MKKYLLAILLFMSAVGGMVGNAAAGPVVAVGSTYSIYLSGSESGEFYGVTTFDDMPAFAPKGALLLTLSESETSLGGGLSRITIDLSANGELFTSSAEQLLLAIGVDGNGLDLLTAVALDDARIIFRNAANEVLRATDNMAGDVPQNDPWDGFFPAPASAFTVNDIGGLGVTRITFDFLVSEAPAQVPEPGSMVLGGIGLLAICVARRRNGRNVNV